ncbi:N-acetylmuramidase domain-containing protein [Algoriphagus aquimarinus]|uniref:N-acetylmuramidase domain-containing protein n=1 Tax=Algoriphagus aquimarinus TaxID=237018 RepID=UPI0030DBC39D|tara:strand:- start:250 stop:852 length:603 start_codon:yes stop_codon:yes gene_type:complete
MQYIRLRSRGSSVSFLQELLGKLGYETPSLGYFGVETDVAVKDFQSKNQLVVDGEVGIKTWTLLFDKTKPADVLGDVFLGEQDLIDFAKRYQLELAAAISPDPKFREAALSSASWGSYQVMGFHAIPLGYPSVQQFVDEMYKHERNHLEVFGRYILKNDCLAYLQSKNWAKFAECYNGSGYAQNKYDEKMAKAYLKFSTQ